jgi:hypothetical protein
MKKKEFNIYRYEDLYTTDRYAYNLLHEAFEQRGLDLRKGDVVTMTEWGRQNLKPKNSTDGVVTSNPRKTGTGNCINVRPIGRKTVGNYWAGFWRKKKITYPL